MLNICPVVSIVVLNYNGLKHLSTCLPSLLRTDYSNYEVILVDNGSSDGSVNFVRSKFPEVKIIRSEHNLGAAGGYNLGVVHAKGKYVAILNNDIEVPPNWLHPLVEVMENCPDVGAVDGKYLSYHNRNRFDTCAAAGRYIDFLANPVTRGCDEDDEGQYDQITRIFVALTLFRRRIFEEIGLFDENFFFGYEDVDLSWRINLRGYRILYVPSCCIYHKSGSSCKVGIDVSKKLRMKQRFYFHNKKNKIITLLKNYSSSTLLFVLPLAIFEHLGYVIYWSIKGNKRYSFESVKAILWILKKFNEIWTGHRFVQNIRKIGDLEIMKIMALYFGDPLKLLRGLK